MATPRLSIAMCTYNGARFLSEQLESIAVQTRLPDELIVCDDRSTDGSVEIIRNFALHAPFEIRLEINTNNLGSTKNFEKAIGLCKGEIIALADQDDVFAVVLFEMDCNRLLPTGRNVLSDVIGTDGQLAVAPVDQHC